MTVTQRALVPWVIAIAGVFAIAVGGGLATDIGPWYFQLKKPLWQPPDWLFGPVWTIIFALFAVAAAKSWVASTDTAQRRLVVILFLLNGVLNIAWSALFFSLRRPDWALVQVAFLWLSVALIMGFLSKVYRPVIWLLSPYLVWVTFAAALNVSIVRLNAPFGAV